MPPPTREHIIPSTSHTPKHKEIIIMKPPRKISYFTFLTWKLTHSFPFTGPYVQIHDDLLHAVSSTDHETWNEKDRFLNLYSSVTALANSGLYTHIYIYIHEGKYQGAPWDVWCLCWCSWDSQWTINNSACTFIYPSRYAYIYIYIWGIKRQIQETGANRLIRAT